METHRCRGIWRGIGQAVENARRPSLQVLHGEPLSPVHVEPTAIAFVVQAVLYLEEQVNEVPTHPSSVLDDDGREGVALRLTPLLVLADFLLCCLLSRGTRCGRSAGQVRLHGGHDRADVQEKSPLLLAPLVDHDVRAQIGVLVSQAVDHVGRLTLV